MNSSPTAPDPVLPDDSALQHERSPRPLPLFLELIRQVSERDPELAHAALVGLRAYASAPRAPAPPERPECARVSGACLRDFGGSGPPAVLIPSLINPPRILDLDAEVSLAAAVSAMGRRALLLDWGEAAARADLSVGGHVEQLLLPLLRSLSEPAALIGYCLGGTIGIAAANLVQCERVATLACPWAFSRYPEESRVALLNMWSHSAAAARSLGALPMEVLQASFWSLAPERTIVKFAEFGRYAAESPEARRFIALEDWANEGEPLPYPAARELIEDLFGQDLPGGGEWRVAGRVVDDAIDPPLLNVTADRDRIVPASTAPRGTALGIATGHVGMIVGSARSRLHQALRRFLDPACR